MITKVRPVTLSDFDRIHDALLHDLNPRFTRERWRGIFDWGWENPEDHVGYVMETGEGNPVGFVGTIYHDLEADGALHRVCNLTSWTVKDGYGSSALALVAPVLRRKELTVTNLTSIPGVNAMFRRLGFVQLESHVAQLIPHPAQWLRGGPWKVQAASGGDQHSLSSAAQKALRDHEAVCSHLIFSSSEVGESSLVSYFIGRRRGIRVARVIHLSEPGPFVSALAALQRWWLTHEGVMLVEMDERLLVGERVPGLRRIPLASERLFRGESHLSQHLSNLYSEIPLLRIH